MIYKEIKTIVPKALCLFLSMTLSMCLLTEPLSAAINYPAAVEGKSDADLLKRRSTSMHKLSRCRLIITGIAAWSAGLTARAPLQTLSLKSTEGIFRDSGSEFSWLIYTVFAASIGLAALLLSKNTQERLAKLDRLVESTFVKVLCFVIIMALIFAALAIS